MTKKHQFNAIIEQDEDGMFVAEIPSLRACYAQGRTFEEAVANLQDVLEMCLEEMKSRDEEIPGAQAFVGMKVLAARI